MALDLDKINEFFKDYENQKNLPAEIAQTVVNGNSLKYGGLELTVKNKSEFDPGLVELLTESYYWNLSHQYKDNLNKIGKFFVLYMNDGNFMLYEFPGGQRIESPEKIWNNAIIPSLAKKMNVSKEYRKVIKNLEKRSTDFFEYSGSAHGQNLHNLIDAYQEITEDLDVMRNLTRLGVVPKLEVGSRSQSSHYFSTNFCLDTFKEVGITDANQMITLAEEGITPFHLEHFKNAGRKVQRKRNDLVEAVKDFYGSNFIAANVIVNDLYRNHTKTYSPNTKERNSTIKDWELVCAQAMCR